VQNYFYARTTGNSNLRRHLTRQHPKEYDTAIMDNNWDYKLSTHSDDTAHNNNCNVANSQVPPFSPQTFLEYLVRFVVADDQVCLKDFMFFYSHFFSHFGSSTALSFDNYV
jgi:hypothetical protein